MFDRTSKALTKMQGIIIVVIIVVAAIAGVGAYYLTTKSQANANDTLVLGTTWVMTSADPHVGTSTGLNQNIPPAISDHLFWMSADNPGQVQGELAEKFEVRYETINGTQRPYLWVKLREGLHRNDGSEITAQDIVYTWQRFAKVAPEQLGVIEWGFSYDDFGNDTWVALSKYEVKERIPTAFPMVAILLQGYSCEIAEPISQAVADQYPLGSIEIAEKGLSGPLTMTEVVPNDHVTLEVRQNYKDSSTGGWVQGMGKATENWPPQWKKCIIRTYGDASALALALKNGEVDIAVGDLNVADILNFKTDSNMVVLEQSGGCYRFLTLNYKFPPLDNVKVRQAIAYALDFSENVNTVKQGLAEVAKSCVHSYYPYYTPAFYDTYNKAQTPRDVNKSKALLAEAGYPNGFEVTMVVTGHYGPLEEEKNDALIIQKQLRDVGITLNIQQVDESTYKSMKSDGLIPIFMGGFYPDFPDPENDIEIISMHGEQYGYYTAASNQTKYPEEIYHFKEFNGLVEQGMTLWNASITVDQNTQRKDCYLRQQAIFAEEVYALPAYFSKGFMVARSYVKDLEPHPVMTNFATPGILACSKQKTTSADFGFAAIVSILSIELPAMLYARKLKSRRHFGEG